MKKYIYVMLLIALTVLLLTACSCKHEWTEADCTTPKTCSLCKVTEGEAKGHIWTDATCTTPKTCSICKVTEGTYGEHNWQDATCTTPKTCSVCHKTEGDVVHKWTNATCTTPKTCSICNKTEGDVVHKWTNATCTTPKTCSVCNITEGDVVHEWINATCTTPQTCSICKKTDGVALGHTSDEKCSRCGQVNKNIVIQKAKNAVYIYGIDLDMNSAGGIDTYITWKNVSQKEIKYIHFYVQYYNRVKDVLSNEINGATTTRLSATGPFPYGKGNYNSYSYSLIYGTAECLYFTVSSGYKNDKENGWADRYWEAPFYNTTTKYIKLTKIEIEYMDGTYYTISDPDAIAAVVGSGEHPNAWSTDDTGDDYLR